MPIDTSHYRFGVNYTPTRNWWYCWNDFDADAIARDLDAIHSLGADHIRIMLLWHFFQPNPAVVSETHLERLRTLMHLADERSLDVCVALFVGWLSGYSFKPPFQSDASFFDLSEENAPQGLYLRQVASQMKAYDNFLGFDLGNELNICWKTDHLAQGDNWHNHMLALARAALPSGVHVNGVDHNPWFSPASFSPRNLAVTQPIVALHCWTYFTGALARSGGDGFQPPSLWLLAAMAALARSYAGDPEKPVWVQEYGMSEDWMDAGDIARFLQRTTLHGIEAGVSWFTWWASHDLDHKYAFHPLEYSLGLITQDQQVKPQGQVFRELAETYRGREATKARAFQHIPPPSKHDDAATWQWLEEWMRLNDCVS